MSNGVPAGWEIKALGDIGSVVTGSTPSTQEAKYWGGNIPFISPADFEGRVYITKTGRTLSAEGAEKARLLPKNAILVTCIGSLGGMAMTSQPSVTNQQINAVIAEDGQESRFHFYNILFNIHELTRNAGTTTLPIINKTTFSQINLLFPPLSEQQKIATILSSVDDVIEKTRAQIDKLKDLKTGMMQELLTKGIGHTEFKNSDVGQIPKSWACELVSNLFEIQLGKMLSQAAKVGVSPLPYLGNKDVQWGKINVTDLQTMDFSERERKKFLLKLGDLLMCEGGEVGRSAIWEGELKECYYQKALHRLRPINKAYEPRLLLEYMRYAKGQNLLADFISQTSIAHLTREKLSAIPVPVPPVAEQKRIVDVITSIDTRINRHLDKLKNTCDIKKALMQDLLTGKVRVKLTDKESAVV